MKYRCLNRNSISNNGYSIVPIRFEDRYKIMHWRNEQIYHLRQAEPLTREQQDVYFEKVVAALFSKEQPEQLLFSYLEQSECIGYGGLVHIDWRNRHAEISFIMKTELEPSAFQFHWGNYLSLIEEVAFQELQLHKIYTYAYDLRPHLYDALELAGYQKEATLKEHCFFNGRFIDVIVHAKYA